MPIKMVPTIKLQNNNEYRLNLNFHTYFHANIALKTKKLFAEILIYVHLRSRAGKIN